MGDMADDPAELALVRKAISLHRYAGCCEWNDKSAILVASQQPHLPMPSQLRTLLCDHVLHNQGQVVQVVEKRNFNFRYYYKVIIPHDKFRRGLFVELRVKDRDPDFPEVEIVNAHEQR